MRILMVDDNERIRRGVMDILASKKNLNVCGEARDGWSQFGRPENFCPITSFQTSACRA
jgi:chemotaxis response regulator CheB